MSPEDIQDLGRQAAQLNFSKGVGLTQAVVRVLSSQVLNHHQIQRVVEATNTTAFNLHFQALPPHNRVVVIKGGPADTGAVMKALDISTKTSASADLSDYLLPPTTPTKDVGEILKHSGLGNPEPEPQVDLAHQGLVKLNHDLVRAIADAQENIWALEFKVENLGDSMAEELLKTARLELTELKESQALVSDRLSKRAA